jgi:phosphatidylglycerophosphate synthase
MAILTNDFRDAQPFRLSVHSPLFRDTGLYLALLGGVLALAVLYALGAGVLGWRGSATALASYGLMAMLVMAGLARHEHRARFGLANAITLTRAAVTALLFGVVGEWLFGGSPAFNDPLRWALVGAAGLILALDGIDGQVARRSNMASPFGARFDMEADALFILAIYTLAVATGAVGVWILACCSLRYIFVAAARFAPWLNAPLPPALRRKSIYVVQAAAPIIALTPVCPPWLAGALCAAAFLFVLFSFATDCLWLAMNAARSEAGRDGA